MRGARWRSIVRRALAIATSAAASMAAAQTDGRDARIAEGARIAAQGTPQGAAPCAGCHGQKGEGRAGAGMPRLAGQPASYLDKQLEAYADGRRPANAIMAQIARSLDDAQRAAAAAYYASLGADARPRPATPPASTSAARRADTLMRVGDRELGVQACANCHGPGGSGVAPTFPSIAGQHSDYLLDTMRRWRDGTRRSDPSGQMNTIAARLRESDLRVLADRLSELPPGLPHARDAVAAGRIATAPAARGAPAQAGPATAGQRANAGAEPSGPRRSASDPPAGTPGAPAAGAAAQGAGAAAPDSVRGGSQAIGGGGGASGSGAQGSRSGDAR